MARFLSLADAWPPTNHAIFVNGHSFSPATSWRSASPFRGNPVRIGRSPVNCCGRERRSEQNAEEAKAAFSRRDFACRSSVVLREARESRFWLRVIAANKLPPEETIEPLLAEVNELVGIYTATVRKAKLPRAPS